MEQKARTIQQQRIDMEMQEHDATNAFQPENTTQRKHNGKSRISIFDDPKYTSEDRMVELALRWLGDDVIRVADYGEILEFGRYVNVCGGMCPPRDTRIKAIEFAQRYDIDITPMYKDWIDAP